LRPPVTRGVKDAKAVLQEEECTEEIRRKYCVDPDNMEQCPEECE